MKNVSRKPLIVVVGLSFDEDKVERKCLRPFAAWLTSVSSTLAY